MIPKPHELQTQLEKLPSEIQVLVLEAMNYARAESSGGLAQMVASQNLMKSIIQVDLMLGERGIL